MTIRAIQPNPSYDMVIPKKLHHNKIEKVTEAFLRLTPPPSILTDRQTDDGHLGIRKAPMPLCTAELIQIRHKPTCLIGFGNFMLSSYLHPIIHNKYFRQK